MLVHLLPLLGAFVLGVLIAHLLRASATPDAPRRADADARR